MQTGRPIPLETISEKLAKFLQDKNALVPTRPISFVASNDYSQTILISRINYYLNSINEKEILDEGYCHGLTLLWLTMMSWGVESLFYQIIKMIAECPLDQLVNMGNIITPFLDMIDVGQYPEKRSNNHFKQSNVIEIIGEVYKIFTATKKLTPKKLESRLQSLGKENNMMAITGWPKDRQKGHTVGVFVRGPQYHFYDSNFDDLGAHEYVAQYPLAREIWEQVFSHKRITEEKVAIRVIHPKTSPLVSPSRSIVDPQLIVSSSQSVSSQPASSNVPSRVCCKKRRATLFYREPPEAEIVPKKQRGFQLK